MALTHFVIAYPADGSRPLLREVATPAEAQARAAAAFGSGRYARVVLSTAYQAMQQPTEDGKK